MTTAEISTGGKERQVGQVHIEITVTNLSDAILARNGHLAPGLVRTETMSDVLVDTGALMLCLPADAVARLGLEVDREVQVETAAGPSRMRIMRGVTLEVMGRGAPFQCIETPAGTPPLLGAIPMETLGLQPDLQNQRLIQLPDNGPGTYILAY